MHTKPMEDSDGTFDQTENTLTACHKCKQQTVEVKEWNSSCGGYTDYKYTCTNPACKHYWWVDGADS